MQPATDNTIKIQHKSIFSYAGQAARNYASDSANVRRWREQRWSGDTMSTEDALKIASAGGYWEAGAAGMAPMELPINGNLARAMTRPQSHRSVTGYRAHVPSVVTGHPLAMLRRERDPAPNRLFKIGVVTTMVYSAKPYHFLNRGKAVLSAVDALSAAGYNVELIAVDAYFTESHGVRVETVIKDSDRAYSPAAVAFAFANDAFSRRLGFTEIDRLKRDGNSDERAAATDLLNNGLGNGERGAARLMPGDFDLFFPYLSPDQFSDYSTPATASTTVVRMLSEKFGA